MAKGGWRTLRRRVVPNPSTGVSEVWRDEVSGPWLPRTPNLANAGGKSLPMHFEWHPSTRPGTLWRLWARWRVHLCPQCNEVRYVYAEGSVQVLFLDSHKVRSTYKPMRDMPAAVKTVLGPAPEVRCACAGRYGPRRLQFRGSKDLGSTGNEARAA